MKSISTRSCEIVTVIVFLASAALAQSPQTVICDTAPDIRAALDRLPQYRQDRALTDWQVYQQRLSGIKALMQQHPDDVFVQEAYINSMTSLRSFDKASVEEKRRADEEFKAKYDKHPEDARLTYLYALTLHGRNTSEAMRLFESALEKDPAFELPHLALAATYGFPTFRDKEKSKAHISAFFTACPASFYAYSYRALIEDNNLVASYGAKLRAVLQDRSDPSAVAAYRTLWAIEFKARQSSEHDVLRKQVTEDLDRIRKISLQDRREWYETLDEGYKLVNDKKQADWAESEMNRRFPSAGYIPGRDKWFKEHPSPEGESLNTRQAYYHDLLKQTDSWLKEKPESVHGDFEVWSDRLRAMIHLDDVPAPDVELAVEQMLKTSAENGGDSPWSYDLSPWSDDYSLAAKVLSKKHLQPERVVEYAQKAMDIVAAGAKEPLPDYLTSDIVSAIKLGNEYLLLDAMGYEARGYLQLRQEEKADAVLAEFDLGLEKLKSMVGDKDERKQKAYFRDQAAYWVLRAQEAEVNGRSLDAMALYERALLTRLDAKVNPEPDEKDELAEDAHRLWLSLKGSESGWQLWYAHPANDLANQVSLAWEKANQPFPAFSLDDVNGKHWTAGSLKGKVTVVSVWATWCGPCREELPQLQKLTEQYKDRSDVQFISMNVDENPGLIQSFLAERELSFTVIPAASYVNDTLNITGIPQNWIIDGNGTVRLKGTGYATAENWVKGMQNAIQEVEASTATTASTAGSL